MTYDDKETITLDQFIAELEAIRNNCGGATPVVCFNSDGEHMPPVIAAAHHINKGKVVYIL